MTVAQWLLDGTDISTFGDVTDVQSDLGLVGDDVTVAYRPGVTFRRRTAGAGDLQLGMVVGDADSGGVPGGFTQWLANWRAFRAFVWRPDAARTLTRRVTLPDTTVEEAAAAVTLMQLPQAGMVGAAACTTVLDLRILDGYLYGTSDITITSGGSPVVLGDARTQRLTITLPPGTLSNDTTGAALTNSGPNPLSIDVNRWIAIDTVTFVDAAQYLSWPGDGHDFWFDLDPGENDLEGDATIVYRPAYLPTA